MADLKIFTENIEHEALNQIYTLVKQPAFSDCKIRIMPDVHAGAGCVIGFTADLGEKVIPNIVGVDIGCGMLTTNLGNIDIDFERLDNVIRKYVPSGRKVHEEENSSVASDIIEKLYCKEQLKNIDWLKRSCGTLGGAAIILSKLIAIARIINILLFIREVEMSESKLQKYISKWRLMTFRENRISNKIVRN